MQAKEGLTSEESGSQIDDEDRSIINYVSHVAIFCVGASHFFEKLKTKRLHNNICTPKHRIQVVSRKRTKNDVQRAITRIGNPIIKKSSKIKKLSPC